MALQYFCLRDTGWVELVYLIEPYNMGMEHSAFCVYVSYSMSGKYILHIALDHYDDVVLEW